jgi:hypothetical protein
MLVSGRMILEHSKDPIPEFFVEGPAYLLTTVSITTRSLAKPLCPVTKREKRACKEL